MNYSQNVVYFQSATGSTLCTNVILVTGAGYQGKTCVALGKSPFVMDMRRVCMGSYSQGVVQLSSPPAVQAPGLRVGTLSVSTGAGASRRFWGLAGSFLGAVRPTTFNRRETLARRRQKPPWKSTGHAFIPHSPAPVPPSNRPFRHTYNPLFSNAFCVCQMNTVLHYSLRTESKTESKRGGNGQIFGASRTP